MSEIDLRIRKREWCFGGCEELLFGCGILVFIIQIVEFVEYIWVLVILWLIVHRIPVLRLSSHTIHQIPFLKHSWVDWNLENLHEPMILDYPHLIINLSFFFFLIELQGWQDLSFLTRMEHGPLTVKLLHANHWTARKSQIHQFYQT